MQKTWCKWYEVCENCGGQTEALTLFPGSTVEGSMGEDGDIVRCRSCYCQGRIMKDIWGFYAEWPDDMCAKCYRELDAKMKDLAARVKEELIHKYKTLREVKIWMEVG